MSKEGFGPGGDKIPKGATPATLMGQANPVLGHQTVPSNKGMAGGVPQTAQRTAQLSPAQTPRGAQQVPIAGMAAAPAQAPATFMATQPRMAGAAAPESNDVHTIRVEGLGADGRRYKADFDAVFPKGTKIVHLGVVE